MKARSERLAELLPDAEADVMLVTDLVNVRYLTGYSGSNGLALIGPQTRTFVTDFRYVEQAAEEVHPSFERRRAPQDLVDAIGDALPDGVVRLGFEAAHTSVRAHTRLAELLGGRAELVATTGLVERLRAIKEPEEIDRIRAATVLADTAFERLISDGLIGRTERELAIALEFDMRRRGAERASFDPIIAAGPHGALPHAQPREVEIRRGDIVVIDWGAELDGYCSDCTRTVAAGEPSAEAREIYELVLQAQLAGVNAVKAGADGRDVDGIARAVIDEGGHGDEFGHGLGHGVGLAVHEAPRLSQRSDDVLAPGNVVTVEPGIYMPGRFGVRIEDLVVATDNGADVLTSVSKRLIVTD
ncbi:MAG TPA: Xaa-Pro peptidase family protein [Solirubrobacteraceae bacterium]|jgi:Xaa-Pro aminopeptidase|nr:Xaa-Pro peptidase family protein [Solirubrobacteraceae bacterium]